MANLNPEEQQKLSDNITALVRGGHAFDQYLHDKEVAWRSDLQTMPQGTGQPPLDPKDPDQLALINKKVEENKEAEKQKIINTFKEGAFNGTMTTTVAGPDGEMMQKVTESIPGMLPNMGPLSGMLGGMIGQVAQKTGILDYGIAAVRWLTSLIGHMFNKDTKVVGFGEALSAIHSDKATAAGAAAVAAYTKGDAAVITDAMKNAPALADVKEDKPKPQAGSNVQFSLRDNLADIGSALASTGNAEATIMQGLLNANGNKLPGVEAGDGTQYFLVKNGEHYGIVTAKNETGTLKPQHITTLEGGKLTTVDAPADTQPVAAMDVNQTPLKKATIVTGKTNADKASLIADLTSVTVDGASDPTVAPLLAKLSQPDADGKPTLPENSSHILVKLTDNTSAIVSGKLESGKFTPTDILRVSNGSVVSQHLPDGTSPFAITKGAEIESTVTPSSAPAAGSGTNADAKLTPKLAGAVADYAKLRFSDLSTGKIDQAKADEFVRRYTALITSEHMSAADQDARAAEIIARKQAIVDKLQEATRDQVKIQASDTKPEDKPALSKGMMNAIDQAVKLMTTLDPLIKSTDQGAEVTALTGLLSRPATPASDSGVQKPSVIR